MNWEKTPDIQEGEKDKDLRFALGIGGNKILIIIGLNPSTASKKKQIKRC